MPECTGCKENEDCDDGVVCTADTCDDGRCLRALLPAGAECPDGVCNGGGASNSCVPCVDNQTAGPDAGCDVALPLCDATQSPAVCVECVSDADCDDENECTTETCSSNQCVFQTVPAGEECVGGICSGVAGSESCGACLDTVVEDGIDQGCTEGAPVCDMAQVPPACTGCTTHEDCDDGIECTTDVCNESQVCVYETDHGLCDASGDVCAPNRCVVGMGCTIVDVTEEPQLLVDPNFESGGGAWEWTSILYDDMIVAQWSSTPMADTPTWLSWMGGEPSEVSEMWQTVTLPEGTQSITVSFKYYLRGDELYYYDDHSMAGAELWSGDGNAFLYEFMTVGNQDADSTWTEFTETIDATSWAGTEVQLYFWVSVGPYLYECGEYPDYYYCDFGVMDFFVDTTSLTATVCE